MHKIVFSLFLFLIGCSVQNPSIYQSGISEQNVEPHHNKASTLLSSVNNVHLKRIDKTINAEIESGKIPGAVALVSINGERVYYKSFGFADIEEKKLMRKDSIFRIASMTKAITTVAVMQLYEKGLFQLNDPVSNYLPSFKNPKVLVAVDENNIITETRDATNEIKIIDLLTHSSGLGYPFINSPLQKTYIDNGIINGITDKDITLSSQIKKLSEQPLLFDPGDRYSYGLNTDVLGYLIEVISGQTLNDYFRNEIFLPLEMYDTYFYLPNDKHHRLATLYAYIDKKLISYNDDSFTDLGNNNYPISGAMTYYSGGAGLSSTVSDYSRFVEMLFNYGKLNSKRLLSRKSVELMISPRMDMNSDGILDFALGFRVINNIGLLGELGTSGSYSWGGAFNTAFWVDPEEQMFGIIMSQVRPNKSNINERFKTMVYKLLE